MASEAFEVQLHDGLALGVVVQGKGPALGGCRLAGDLAAAGGAEGAHLLYFLGVLRGKGSGWWESLELSGVCRMDGRVDEHVLVVAADEK